MKKVLIGLLCLLLTLCATGVALSEPRVGGWEMPEYEAAALPEDAQTAFDRAVEGMDGANYTPVALLGTQLVAGMNYCILCQITPIVPDAESGWGLVYIYADLQGNAEITRVVELDIPGMWNPN